MDRKPTSDPNGGGRRWWAVTIEPTEGRAGTGPEEPGFDVDAVSALFYAEGAAGVEWEDGAPSHPAWADDVPRPGRPFVRAYFPDDAGWSDRRDRLERRVLAEGLRLCVEAVAEEDWATGWKRYYRAVRPGRRLWVVPAWEDPPDPAAPIIRIDPGMAFGTGTHPTTALMLTLIEDVVTPGTDWIDVGTGSGILALAAWLLGARVIAVEPDPVAVEVAGANFSRHGAPIALVAGTLLDLVPDGPKADGLMANLTARIIADELQRFVAVSAPGAVWLLSGILEEHGPWLKSRLEEAGRTVTMERRDGGWLAWVVEPS